MTGLQLAQYEEPNYFYSGYETNRQNGGMVIIEMLHMDPLFFTRGLSSGGMGMSATDSIYTLGWSSMKMLMSNQTNAEVWYRVYYIYPRKDIIASPNTASQYSFYRIMSAYNNNGAGSIDPVNQQYGMMDLNVTDESRKMLRVKRGKWHKLRAGTSTWVRMKRNHRNCRVEGYDDLQYSTTGLLAMRKYTYGFVVQAIAQPLNDMGTATVAEAAIRIATFTHRRASWRLINSNNPNFYWANLNNTTAQTDMSVVNTAIPQTFDAL